MGTSLSEASNVSENEAQQPSRSPKRSRASTQAGNSEGSRKRAHSYSTHRSKQRRSKSRSRSPTQTARSEGRRKRSYSRSSTSSSSESNYSDNGSYDNRSRHRRERRHKKRKTDRRHRSQRRSYTPTRNPRCYSPNNRNDQSHQLDDPVTPPRGRNYGYSTENYQYSPQGDNLYYTQEDEYQILDNQQDEGDFDPPSRVSTPAGIEDQPYQAIQEQLAQSILDPVLPPSPPENLLTKVHYPPDGALPEILPESNEILFSFKNRRYGRFKLVGTDPIAFRVVHSCLLPPSIPFLNECYDDPNKRPESSKTSEDLSAATNMFTEALQESLGFALIQTPPGINIHKIHPLHNDIRLALNKHRDQRTPVHELRKIVQDVDTQSTSKKLLSMKNRPLPPKNQDFMTVTPNEKVDEVISFLNTGTASNFSYVSDLNTAFAYFSIPSIKTLSLQHQLKEEVLFFLGLYNFVAATHTAVAKVKERTPSSSASGDLESIKRWNAYGYKSIAKMAKKSAEKLGAACLLLRHEAIAQQSAPELAEILIYTQDIVSPHILMLRGQTFFDAAIANKTIMTIKRVPQDGAQNASREKHTDWKRQPSQGEISSINNHASDGRNDYFARPHSKDQPFMQSYSRGNRGKSIRRPYNRGSRTSSGGFNASRRGKFPNKGQSGSHRQQQQL